MNVKADLYICTVLTMADKSNGRTTMTQTCRHRIHQWNVAPTVTIERWVACVLPSLAAFAGLRLLTYCVWRRSFALWVVGSHILRSPNDSNETLSNSARWTHPDDNDIREHGQTVGNTAAAAAVTNNKQSDDESQWYRAHWSNIRWVSKQLRIDSLPP